MSEQKSDESDVFDDRANDTAVKFLDKYEYKPNMGESHQQYYKLVINLVDFESGEVSMVKGIPDNVIPILPVFTHKDQIVFTGYNLNENEYLKGIAMCYNRSTSIYLLNEIQLQSYKKKSNDKTENCEDEDVDQHTPVIHQKLSDDENGLAYCPIISPSGDKLAYFYHDKI